MISRSYHFSATARCLNTGLEIHATCIFFDGRKEVTEFSFFDELGRAQKASSILPDCFVVFAPPNLANILLSYWITSKYANLFRERGIKDGKQYIKEYVFISLDVRPTENIKILKNEDKNPQFGIPIKEFLQAGLTELIRKNPVVQLAPSGHVFRHPSGTINKTFIQARELANSEPELSFIGYCLCARMRDIFTEDLGVVFIDTMSIYAIAREALNIAGVDAKICSFHSYDQMKDMIPPAEPYLVLISASTSGGMATSLRDEKKFSAERLATLVDVTADRRCGTILIPLDSIDDSYKASLVDGTETEIELVGEHFSSKAKPPRAVTLGHPHTPKSLGTFLSHFGLNGLENINQVTTGRSAPRPISLKAQKIAEINQFDSWLEQEIMWSVPAGTDNIVCTEDAGSIAIATRAADILCRLKGHESPSPIKLYNPEKMASLGSATGILVITAIAGDGSLLREISRDLRELAPAASPRHFLVAVGFPQSVEAWERLRQFLERNSTNRLYGFSSWLVLPNGPDGANNFWADLTQLASKAEVRTDFKYTVDTKIIDDSLQMFLDSVEKSYHGFLPRNDGSPLSLSEGFIFFGDYFKGAPLTDIPDSCTYLTIAAVLQSARDLKSPTNQLRPNGYESVVLSPENFLRFNDNLLQACLLRSAYATELDYSASPTMSSIMKEFLIKVFRRQAHKYGAAALEFAVAIATGRLRLKKNDMEEVLNISVEGLKEKPSALLGILLMVKC